MGGERSIDSFAERGSEERSPENLPIGPATGCLATW